jgi:hypothetical protein
MAAATASMAGWWAGKKSVALGWPWTIEFLMRGELYISLLLLVAVIVVLLFVASGQLQPLKLAVLDSPTLAVVRGSGPNMGTIGEKVVLVDVFMLDELLTVAVLVVVVIASMIVILLLLFVILSSGREAESDVEATVQLLPPPPPPREIFVWLQLLLLLLLMGFRAALLVFVPDDEAAVRLRFGAISTVYNKMLVLVEV